MTTTTATSHPSSSSSSDVDIVDGNDGASAVIQSPIFVGSSSSTTIELPSILTVSFAGHDPNVVSLGVQLANHDNGLTNEIFIPGYASVGCMLDDVNENETDISNGDGGATRNATRTTRTTLARKCGVKVGDIIVAVNDMGYRRFPPDYDDETVLVDVTLGCGDLIDLSSSVDGAGDGRGKVEGGQLTEEEYMKNMEKDQRMRVLNEKRKSDGARVISSNKPGESYSKLLLRIRNIKMSNDASDPLVLNLERYSWDSRVHSWSRFLSARNGNVPLAMNAIQRHERWRSEFFPIDLTVPSLQGLFRSRAVSVIDRRSGDGSNGEKEGGKNGGDKNDCIKAPVVYIDFAKLQKLGAESDSLSDDVVKAFVVYTETLLSKSPDPRSPKSSQFVDLTGVSIKGGLRPGPLRKLYETFEPNYPETLERMVIYPVPKLLVKAVNAMLSFVNEHTRKKFVITDDLDVVCDELGWDVNEIARCRGVNGYMNEHVHRGSSFVFD